MRSSYAPATPRAPRAGLPGPLRAGALLLLLALPACEAPPPERAEKPRRPPNVVLLVADDLGYGDLGCYGQPRIATPNLDRMAREGTLFTRFYAGDTVCAPSRCALLTGLHTGHCRIRGNRRQDLLPEDVTFAEILRDAGYHTALFGKWGLGTEGGTGVPTRQGFEHFLGYLDQVHAHNYYPTFLIEDEGRRALPNVVPNERPDGGGVASKRVVYSHDLITDEALSWLDARAASPDEPFLLTVTWTLPHANNEAGDKGMEVPDLGQYADEDWPEPARAFAAMVTRMDRDVGRLLEHLRADGIDDDTLVLFTSDNGPHSEGGHRSWFFQSSAPLRGQKRDLLEGGIRVPLIARWPGRVPAGRTCAHVSAFWDVLPTLAELAGRSSAVPAGTDGISFVPALLGIAGVQPEHVDLYWAFYERGAGRALLYEGRWKAIEQPLGTPVRLYDVEADPAEETDLAADHPALVDDLVRRMDAEDVPAPGWVLPIAGRK